MSIVHIINEFESNFGSTFQSSARRYYEVDFSSSTIQNILSNLQTLEGRIKTDASDRTKEKWWMELDFVQSMQLQLSSILEEYEKRFYSMPTNKKIFEVTQKLRESEQPSAKEIASKALEYLFTPGEGKKQTKRESKEREAAMQSLLRAQKATKKLGVK